MQHGKRRSCKFLSLPFVSDCAICSSLAGRAVRVHCERSTETSKLPRSLFHWQKHKASLRHRQDQDPRRQAIGLMHNRERAQVRANLAVPFFGQSYLGNR